MNSALTPQPAPTSVQTETPTNEKSSNHEVTRLSDVGDLPVLLDFEGGNFTSDAGILLLREVEQQHGIIKALAEVIEDPRDVRYVKHSIMDLMMQRISQIASGYEDANDCNELRDDPIFKMLADRLPESDPALASQPTMSRFENSISRSFLFRLAKTFVDVFLASYPSPPEVIVLDFDDTEDKVYGGQQQALFNGYFKDHCFMPLHIYEGLSGKLIATILRPGKRAKGKVMLSIVKRLVKYLRAHWPNTVIIFRGDGHFSYPEVMDWIEAQSGVRYVIGFTGNKKIQKLVETQEQRALKLYERNKHEVRLYHSFSYKAESWSKDRRIVAKIEVNAKGRNLRFVVTDLVGAKAKALYTELYCDRGNAELYIKDHKLYLKSGRTSCQRFLANQFRLFLHSAAYVLIHALKTNLLQNTQLAKATMQTIRLRLFKIAARVRQLKTRVKIELPSSYPLKEVLRRSFLSLDLARQKA